MCLIWGCGLFKGNQVEMRSLGWVLMQCTWCPHTRGKFGHRNTNRRETVWRDTRRRPSTSQGERPRADPSSALRKHRTCQHLDESRALTPAAEWFSLSPSILSYILSGSVLKRSPCVVSLGLMANLVQCTGPGSPDKWGSEDQGWCLGIREPHLHEVRHPKCNAINSNLGQYYNKSLLLCYGTSDLYSIRWLLVHTSPKQQHSICYTVTLSCRRWVLVWTT